MIFVLVVVAKRRTGWRVLILLGRAGGLVMVGKEALGLHLGRGLEHK